MNGVVRTQINSLKVGTSLYASVRIRDGKKEMDDASCSGAR